MIHSGVIQFILPKKSNLYVNSSTFLTFHGLLDIQIFFVVIRYFDHSHIWSKSWFEECRICSCFLQDTHETKKWPMKKNTHPKFEKLSQCLLNFFERNNYDTFFRIFRKRPIFSLKIDRNVLRNRAFHCKCLFCSAVKKFSSVPWKAPELITDAKITMMQIPWLVEK